MNNKWLLFLFIIALSSSCKKDDEKLLAEQQKDEKAKELIFTKISNGWHFVKPTLDSETQVFANDWEDLRQFTAELNETPKSSIGAFQKKSRDLSKKALALNNNIPPTFNTLYIKSRISALITKINMIDLFINLDAIPEQKVIALVKEVNEELISLYKQMEELNRRNNIPREEGESEMIQMLDTTRAIPN
jgi:hypothetical protein